MSRKRERETSASSTAAKKEKTNAGVNSDGDIFQPVELSQDTISLLDDQRKKKVAVAFDEVTLEDKPCSIHPNEVQLGSFITRKVRLRGGGVMSAAMDTVTEGDMALAIAKMGGIGVLHRNLPTEVQCRMLTWVRRKIHFGGMIDKPITFTPDQHFSDVQSEIEDKGYTFTSFPVVDESHKLVGLITRDEMDFVESTNPLLREIMKTDVITANEGTTSEQAYALMTEHKVKKLPVVSATERSLVGMYVWNDVKDDQRKRAQFSLDEDGHFLVAAAIGMSGQEDLDRADQLIAAGCKILVLDSSHGACEPAKALIKAIKTKYGSSGVELIVGNIASYASAHYLMTGDHVPDGLKVGIGPGSICTTRQVTGHGIPQVTAIYNVWRALHDLNRWVPIIADGGIRCSGDIVKCLAVGASAVMLGSVLAGTDEAPGRLVFSKGKKYKTIRGMGSRSALAERAGSRSRYHSLDRATQTSDRLTKQQKAKMVPEGVEGLVELKGSTEKVMTELLGGVRAGLAHSGGANIREFQRLASVWVQSTAGVVEGRPHDLQDIRE